MDIIVQIRWYSRWTSLTQNNKLRSEWKICFQYNESVLHCEIFTLKENLKEIELWFLQNVDWHFACYYEEIVTLVLYLCYLEIPVSFSHNKSLPFSADELKILKK